METRERRVNDFLFGCWSGTFVWKKRKMLKHLLVTWLLLGMVAMETALAKRHRSREHHASSSSSVSSEAYCDLGWLGGLLC